MTNPKLREMLEAASKKLLMPTLGHPSNMLSDRDGIRVLDLAASKFADAALAVFTQYLQEPDVVLQCDKAFADWFIARRIEANDNGGQQTTKVSVDRESRRLAMAAALNSIGGE